MNDAKKYVYVSVLVQMRWNFVICIWFVLHVVHHLYMNIDMWEGIVDRVCEAGRDPLDIGQKYYSKRSEI